MKVAILSSDTLIAHNVQRGSWLRARLLFFQWPIISTDPVLVWSTILYIASYDTVVPPSVSVVTTFMLNRHSHFKAGAIYPLAREYITLIPLHLFSHCLYCSSPFIYHIYSEIHMYVRIRLKIAEICEIMGICI